LRLALRSDDWMFTLKSDTVSFLDDFAKNTCPIHTFASSGLAVFLTHQFLFLDFGVVGEQG
jgi:hypothetical protein